MTWMNRSCEDYQRLWLLRVPPLLRAPAEPGKAGLLRAEQGSGWLTRRALDRHLAGCAVCRDFAEAAGALTRRLAGAGEIRPPEAVLESLRLRARAQLAEPAPQDSGRPDAEPSHLRWDAEQPSLRLDAEQRWWAGAFMGGAVLAAAAGLVLALLRPGAFSGYAAPPAQLEARLDWAQQELDQFSAEPPVQPGRMSFDDRMQSIEHQIRCLEADLEDVNWNTLKQDTTCIDS